jgi:hypothetical protein
MAYEADRQVLLEKVGADARHVWIVADVLGRPTAGDNQCRVPFGFRLREGEVHREVSPGPLGVGIPSLLEIVDDQLYLGARRGSDVDLVARLAQTVDRVHCVQILGGVAHQDKYFLHCLSSYFY